LSDTGFASMRLVGVRLRRVRRTLGLSQQGFADTIRAIGLDLDEPNNCTKRLVQKWEREAHRMPNARYRRAIEAATGAPFLPLCESIAEGDVCDAARRISRVIEAVAVLNSELFELRAFFNSEAHLEAESGHRQPEPC
jgi:transcriptional regulator with XRE-family HTH domain